MSYESLTTEDIQYLAKKLDEKEYDGYGDTYYPSLCVLMIKIKYKVEECYHEVKTLKNEQELLRAFSYIHRLDKYLYEIPSEDLPMYINMEENSFDYIITMWRLKNGF